MKKTILTSLIALSLMLFSCAKKSVLQRDETASAKELQTKMLGKWSFNNVTFPKSLAVAQNRSHAALNGKCAFWGLKPYSSANLKANRPTISESPKPQGKSGFVEFLNNNVYIIYDSEGNFFSGNFEVNDGTSISLEGFGAISEIKFTQQRIDFKISYSATGKTITIVANRAADVPLTNNTKLLCANIWQLTKEENGKEILESPIDIELNNGEVTMVYADRATVLFSVSGTYVIQYFKNGKVMHANMANWKWHPTDAKKFVYWWSDETIDGDNAVAIRELSKDVLKTEEVISIDGEVIASSKLTLRPAK